MIQFVHIFQNIQKKIRDKKITYDLFFFHKSIPSNYYSNKYIKKNFFKYKMYFNPSITIKKTNDFFFQEPEFNYSKKYYNKTNKKFNFRRRY